MPPACILCHSNIPIEGSHVVPNFVIKRLKKGSPVGTFIHSDRLNKIFQDGWKGKYLCSDCELLFCKVEDWFCKTVFDPFQNNSLSKFQYSDELGMFTASLFFRYIHLLAEKNPAKPLPPDLLAISENLRFALLSKGPASITSTMYMVFLFPVTSIDRFPPGINTYFFESIDGKAFDFNPPDFSFWIIYLKLPGMFFLLSGHDLAPFAPYPEPMNAQKIRTTGTMETAHHPAGVSVLVADIFKARALEIQNNYEKLPRERMDKIAAKIKGASAIPNLRAERSYLLDMSLVLEMEKRQSEG